MSRWLFAGYSDDANDDHLNFQESMNYYFSETFHFYFVRVRAEDSSYLESALKRAGIAGFVIDFGGERSAGVVGGRMNLFASARIRRTYSRKKIEDALGTSAQISGAQVEA